MACAWSSMSNGLTATVSAPISSKAPVFSERISTPFMVLTRAPSLATRFMPSKMALTMRAS